MLSANDPWLVVHVSDAETIDPTPTSYQRDCNQHGESTPMRLLDAMVTAPARWKALT